jgi:hypothetical protein
MFPDEILLTIALYTDFETTQAFVCIKKSIADDVWKDKFKYQYPQKEYFNFWTAYKNFKLSTNKNPFILIKDEKIFPAILSDQNKYKHIVNFLNDGMEYCKRTKMVNIFPIHRYILIENQSGIYKQNFSDDDYKKIMSQCDYLSSSYFIVDISEFSLNEKDINYDNNKAYRYSGMDSGY